MSTSASMTIEQRREAVQRLQVRLVRSLVLYGMLLVAAATIVATIYSPGIDQDPRRLIGLLAVGTVIGGCLFSLIFLLPVLRWIGARPEESRILPIWLLIGFAFGVCAVFLTGASQPFVFVFYTNILDFQSVGRLLDDLIDAFFRAPLSSFTFGVFALYIGVLMTPIFGIGAWIIDMFNRMNYPNAYSDPWIESLGDMLPATRGWATSAAPWLSVIGPWALAAAVGGAVLLFAATGPIEFLARLRLG
ncbi:MAG: hypothetical protein OXI16_11270 [Chloroflexota bacterium]|nr:hypothetical protein [Chloroflexota bacterium]